MKNITQTSFFILLLFVGLASCTQSTSTNKKSSTSNPSTSTGTPTDTSTPGTVTGCNGIYRAGATSCYYTNIPRLVFSGLPNKQTYGTTIWSSANGLPSSISPNQFRTDATFSVRMKALYPNGGETSRQGRICGTHFTTNFTKMKISVMLRRSVDSIGEVKELTANVNAYSSTARFTVPGGTNDPYILEVVGLASDHRCQTSIYGALPTQEATACNNGLMLDIPLKTDTSAVTECVAFNLEMATDSSYDLPN